MQLMGWRERESLRAFREEEAARETAEQEERERPIREVQSRVDEHLRQLFTMEKQTVVEGKDEQAWADDLVAGRRMTQAEARKYNGEQAVIFARDNPDFYWNNANADAVIAYLLRNSINIATAETYRRAYLRLTEFGLLEERPAPEPEPELESEQLPKAEPESEVVYHGIDLDTGEPRIYTQWEVDHRLSADEFKQAMGIGNQILARRAW